MTGQPDSNSTASSMTSFGVFLSTTENNKIKASANAAELVGGVCSARAQNVGFVRKSLAFGCLFEPVDSRARLVFRFAMLDPKNFRRDTAQCVSWNDGFIGNRGAEHRFNAAATEMA